MTKHDSKTSDELILDRFGIEWTGPKTPIAVHVDDGYWTPWHLAHAELVELRKKNSELEKMLIKLVDDDCNEWYRLEILNLLNGVDNL
ncbi:MAG TPA: hypothetical protein VIC51_09145 [Psychromonas sp.]